MRRCGYPNERPKITYPRSCLCGYQANNAGSWSYHQRIHEPVPEGQLCQHGCGQPATLKNTGGVFVCVPGNNQCPTLKEAISKRVTNDWIGADERKSQTKVEFFKSCHTNSCIEKIRITKRKKLLIQDTSKDRRRYNRQVHAISQTSLKNFTDVINPEGHVIGRFSYHLDHMVSKHAGFLLGIPATYLGSVQNLEVISQRENNSKFSRCSKHPLDLLKECQAPQDLIDQIHSKILQLGDSFEGLLHGHNLDCGPS